MARLIGVDLSRTMLDRARGAGAVLDWLRGTTLLPVHAALERALGRRLRAAYPADAQGVVLFPFSRRLFIAPIAG